MNIPYKQLFRNRNYVFLLLGRLFRRSALILFSLELIWLTMDITDNSPLHLSIMVMGETLPFIIFGLYGGVKADQWNKKRIMVFSDAGVALLIVLIPVLFSLNELNYYTLLALVVGITIFSCFSEPCYRAILPEIIERVQLQSGNALLDSVQRGASILVPASVGIVLKFTTQIHLFSLACILLGLAFISNLFIHYVQNSSPKKRLENSGAFHEIKSSFAYLKKNKDITFIIVVQGISILINTGLMRVGLPIYLDVYLNKDVSAFGYLTGILGAASFLTSILIGLMKKFNPIYAFNTGIILWGIGLVSIGVFPSMTVIYIGMVLIGIGQASEGLARTIILQDQIPGNMIGKIFSLSSTINYLCDTFSLGAISSVMAFMTTAVLFSGSGGLILAIGVIGTLSLKNNIKKEKSKNSKIRNEVG
ncbi:MFS transporter [Peribacillus sp. NPDC097295]|uniref:MFS transporter n=1 Tax=Peribacillus sp. NPDC097295 TaxID=3364402 RepID=UPI0037FF5C22